LDCTARCIGTNFSCSHGKSCPNSRRFLVNSTPLSVQTISDKVFGLTLLTAAAVIFVYYTLWVIVTVRTMGFKFVDSHALTVCSDRFAFSRLLTLTTRCNNTFPNAIGPSHSRRMPSVS